MPDLWHGGNVERVHAFAIEIDGEKLTAWGEVVPNAAIYWTRDAAVIVDRNGDCYTWFYTDMEA